jgi:hypothetical protein
MTCRSQTSSHGLDLTDIEAASDGLETNLHRSLSVSADHCDRNFLTVFNP